MIVIRSFEERDAAAVSDLVVRTLRTTNRKDYTQDYIEELVLHMQPDHMKRNALTRHFYVAEEDGKIVGSGAIGPHMGKEDESCLYTVFVDPARQGRGIGVMIMDTLEHDEYFRRAKRVVVPASITAAPFYLKLGYTFSEGGRELDEDLLYGLEKVREKENTMEISEILEKMIVYSKGNIHDMEHFVKVWAYAKTIGEQEKLPADLQYILEAAAVVHDIPCPYCREKYGNANGKLQEKEGPALVRDFFSDTDLTYEQVERIAFLVGHHHTYEGVDGPDWQILLEADYIVNASEKGYSKENVRNFVEQNAGTESGKKLIREFFCLD